MSEYEGADIGEPIPAAGRRLHYLANWQPSEAEPLPIIEYRIPMDHDFTYAELEAICCWQASQSGAADFAHMSPMDFEEAKALAGQVRRNRDGSIAILKNRAAVVRLAGS